MVMIIGKKSKTTVSYPYIPHEIVSFGILNRLPVKSLLRFSCVSKLWYATIGDPEFIASNLIRAKEKSSSSIVGLFQVQHENSKQRICDYIFVHKGPEYFRFQTKRWTCKVGDCNGLYCFRSRSGFEICNPSTREFLYHPFPPRPPPGCLKSYGFGFDPLKNEYKVVQIVHGEGNVRRCMVYTLGSNSWRDITVASNLTICLNKMSLIGRGSLGGIVNSNRGFYINRALHWFFLRAHTILSFHMQSETFSLISGPGYTFLVNCCRCFFIEWKGCMCLAFHNILGRYAVIFRYTWKELEHLRPDCNRPKIAWEGEFVYFPYKVKSRVGVLDGESLFYWFSQGHLSLYKNILTSGAETRVKFPLPPGMDYSLLNDYEFNHHVENLLSLKRLVPPNPSQIRYSKDKSLVQVKSVSSF